MAIETNAFVALHIAVLWFLYDFEGTPSTRWLKYMPLLVIVWTFIVVIALYMIYACLCYLLINRTSFGISDKDQFSRLYLLFSGELLGEMLFPMAIVLVVSEAIILLYLYWFTRDHGNAASPAEFATVLIIYLVTLVVISSIYIM